MKKLITWLVVISVFAPGYSQTAVITDDPEYPTGQASTVLDVKSTTKGILIPRVTLTSSLTSPLPVTTPATGLMVYNEGNNQTKGFYFWKDNTWNLVGGSVTADGSETKITAGIGINIPLSGTGTDDHPYVINFAIQSATQATRPSSPYAGQIIVCSNCGQFGELQVYNGTSWVGFSGMPTSAPPAVGDIYQGGKIAYIFGPSDPGYVAGQTHGIISAPSDQSSSARWGCSTTGINGADGTSFGTGYQNTEDIVKGCTTAGTAARLCNDLVLGGYSDWHLPSRDELLWVIANKTAIGGINSSAYYWCSSEDSDITKAIRILASGGTYLNVSKDNYYSVRAVRAF